MAPSGACTNGSPLRLVVSTGNLYSCQAGTWGSFATGMGATVPSVTNVLKGDGSGNAADTKVSITSPTTAGTLAFPTDSATISFQGTDTYIGRATTDTLTNKTYDTAGSGNSFLINSVAVTANTGTGAIARAVSPSFTTPTLGVATATTLNLISFTAPATTWTIAPVVDNQTTNIPAGTLLANTRQVNTTSPLGGGGALSANLTLTCTTCATTTNGGTLSGTTPISISAGGAISIANAAADGATLGAVAFNATDFSCSAGVCDAIGVNGGTFPASATVLGTNSSKRPISATTTGSGTTVVLGTSPSITTGINDTNGNSMFAFTATTSAVDGFTVTNAATANPATVQIAGTGTDSNVSVSILKKGTGVVNLGTTTYNVDPTNKTVSIDWGGTCAHPAIKAAGANGGFDFNGGTGFLFCSGGSNSRLYSAANILRTSFNEIWSWANSTSDATAAPDTGLFRNAAGIVEVNNGSACSTAANCRALKASGYYSGGTTFTTDTGCGTTTGRTGGATNGTFAIGANGPCTVVVTMGNSATASNGWNCNANDQNVLTLNVNKSASTTTTISLSVPTGAMSGDVINFGPCEGY